jgi:hypothetical protein
MHGFLSSLHPEVIFQQFEGVPSSQMLQSLTFNASMNLEIGTKYLAAKLVSVAFLAALAELSGGDTEISDFMGDLPSKENPCPRRRLENYLQPPENIPDGIRLNHEVYDLLANGRNKDTEFDLKQSPLAAYFYAHVGDEGIQQVLGLGKLYPMTPELAHMVLTTLPKHVVTDAAEKVTALAVSRKQQIDAAIQMLA